MPQTVEMNGIRRGEEEKLLDNVRKKAVIMGGSNGYRQGLPSNSAKDQEPTVIHGRDSDEKTHYMIKNNNTEQKENIDEEAEYLKSGEDRSKAYNAYLDYENKFYPLLKDTIMERESKMEMDDIGVRNENVKVSVPYSESLSGSNQLKDSYEYNLNKSPYQPTTQSLYIRTQIFAVLSVSLASLVVGFCTAYTSPALATLMHENSTVAVTKQEGSWVGGLMPLAALVGSAIGGYLIERIGPRLTIMAISVPFIISWLLIATATNIAMIYVGRIIGGFCVGIGSLSFPIYNGEAVQAEVRGQLGLLPTAFGNIGILICFIAGTYFNWSDLAYTGALLPIPYLFMMIFIPETPHWLVSHQRIDKAYKSLEWLRGKEFDVNRELKEISNCRKEHSTDPPFRQLLKPENAKPVLICLGLMFFQQMSGINAVIFYTVTIFKDAGSTIDENLSTIIVGIVNFVSTFLATMLIERLGRKMLLYISGVMMILMLAILGTFFYVKTLYDFTHYGWVPLVSFVVYVVSFSLGFGPIPWLMIGEILPNQIKSTAGSLVTSFNWICTFTVTTTFLKMIEGVGAHGTFWIFGVMCTIGVIYTKLFVPETKGKTLEDIEKMFAKRNNDLKVGGD